jgi:hypothetical protein
MIADLCPWLMPSDLCAILGGKFGFSLIVIFHACAYFFVSLAIGAIICGCVIRGYKKLRGKNA